MVLQKFLYEEVDTPSFDFEEQEKKRQEELLSHFLKLKTTRECEKVYLNELKISISWRNLLRAAKTQELCKNVDAMKESFQKSLEHKSKVISFLTCELEEIKLQQLWNVSFHMNNVREFIEFKKETAQNIRGNYLRDLIELKEQFIEEECMTKQNHLENLAKLNHFMNDAGLLYSKKMQDICSIQNTKMDDVKFRGRQNRIVMQHQFQNDVDLLWKHLNVIFHTGMENSSKKSRMFFELKRKHDETTDHIKQKQEHLGKLIKKVSVLKMKIENSKREHTQKVERLKWEQRVLWACKLELQMQAREKQESAQNQLLMLISQSNSVIKQLKKQKVKGLDILKMKKMVRNFETDYDDDNVHELCFAKSVQEVLKKELSSLKDESLMEKKECHNFDNFWIHHSKIVVQNFALKKELSDLGRENENLKYEVKKTLQVFSTGASI